MSRITEIKEIKIDHECKDNPVYLCWRGTNGGENYWLFHRRQSESLETAEMGTFAPYIDDLEVATASSESLGMEAASSLTIGAYVDEEDLTAGVNPGSNPQLKGLLMSTDVRMLMNPESWASEGPKWMRVAVQKGSFKIIDTDQVKANIELSITLPEIFIQQQ